MEFSPENLKKLLEESKGLRLLPDNKRGAFITGVLNGNPDLQKRVFEILEIAKSKATEAEEEYNKKVSEALSEYVSDVQNLQKKTLLDLRKDAESKEQAKENNQINSLLNTLDTL